MFGTKTGRTNRVGVAGSNGGKRPSMALNFLGDTPIDSRIIYTGGNGTYFDKLGVMKSAVTNTPRIDYGPNPGGVTNWTNNSATNALGVSLTGMTATSNAGIAPDGSSTAYLLADTNATSQHLSSPLAASGYSVIAGDIITWSVYLKANTSSVPILTANGEGQASFDLVAVSTIHIGSCTNSTITYAGNGWYRCTATFTKSNSAPFVYIATTNLGSYTGVGASIYAWGPQLEHASSAGVYVPTSGGVAVNSGASALGLLIEESRTNSIRNSTMVGAASGTPGTLPTNWTQGNTNGLSVTSLTTGVFNGISCIDLRFTQTVSAGIYTLSFDANNIIAALTGQSWALSTYIGLVAGSLNNVTSIVYQNVEYTSGGSVVTSSSSSAIIPTATLTRYPAQIVVAGGGTVAFINPRFLVTTTAGAVDFTLRIGAPQFELGAIPTSFIPTSTVAVTRSNDALTMPFDSWFNASASTWMIEYNAPVSTGRLITATDAGANNQSIMFMSGAANSLNSFLAGANQGRVDAGTFTANATSKVAGTFTTTARSLTANGGATVNSGVGPSSAPYTTLQLGSDAVGGSKLNGYLRRVRYWPRALSSAELILATT